MPGTDDHLLTPEELPLGFELIAETGGNITEARRLVTTIRQARPAYIVRLGRNRFSVWASEPEDWPPPHRHQHSPMKNTDTSQLPPSIERQLSDLEARHKAHKEMLQEHHDRKHDRRDNHRARKFRRKSIPILLL